MEQGDLSAPRIRDITGAFFLGLCRAATLVITLTLVWILWSIVAGGWKAFSWEFLSDIPRQGMSEGGIFPALFGTFCVTLLMVLMAMPLGVFSAVYLVEYAGPGRTARLIRAAVNNLAGVPSIVFGLFGVGFFILFVGRNIDNLAGTGLLFGQPAMLWASATLSCLVLPVVIVATEEALNAVPQSHREAAYGLGATQWQVVSGVVLPQARAGILTGAILAVSRGAGETAPILFTGCAYFLPRLPVTHLFGLIPMVNPLDQFMELSYHIFIMATQSTNTVATRPIQYATTLVLLCLTFTLNLAAILFRSYFRRQVRRVS